MLPQAFMWLIGRYGVMAVLVVLLISPVALPVRAGARLQDEGVILAGLPSNVHVDSLLKSIGNVLFFTASDAQHGLELWKTDGTSAGTGLVKDINAGPDSAFVPWAYTPNPVSSVAINNTLFFVASDGHTGYELWKSDGTAKGTVLVKDTLPGSGPADFDETSITNSLTDVNGTLFFAAVSSSSTRLFDLWKSDGTTAGTKRVKSVEPAHLKNVNGTLFFSRGSDNDEIGGVPRGELWKSNGSSSNTTKVKDVYPNSGKGSIYDLTVRGTTLFFGSTNGDNTLWASDGTSSGTLALKQSADSITDLTSADKLYFLVRSSVEELWASDGTVNGTKLIKQVPNADRLKSVNGKLFFSATAGNSTALWTSNGTAQGTVAVKAIAPGVSLTDFTNVNGKLFFIAQSEGHAVQLWKSDGTSSGTLLVKELKSSSSGSEKIQLIPVKDSLFFMLDERLWKSDGSQAGTVVVQ